MDNSSSPSGSGSATLYLDSYGYSVGGLDPTSSRSSRLNRLSTDILEIQKTELKRKVEKSIGADDATMQKPAKRSAT